MSLKRKTWLLVAAALSAANVGAVWVAAADPLHASTHATLAVGFALWAQWLGLRRRAVSVGDESLSDEILEELPILRSEVAELTERLDFAERLLAQRPAAENRPSSMSP